MLKEEAKRAMSYSFFPTLKPRASSWTLTKLVVIFLVAVLMFLPAPSHFSTGPIHSSHTPSNTQPIVSTTPALPSPGFNISANPNSITIAPGSATTSTIKLASLSGFTGQVYLASTSFLSIASLDKTNITLTPGGTATATLTIVATSNPVESSDIVTVEASAGCALTHEASVGLTFTRPDFAMSPSKTQTTISPSASDTATISLTSIFSFSGSIILTASGEGPVLVGLNVSSIELSAGGSGTASLTIYVPAGTPPGNYTVSVEGVTSDFSLFHSSDVSVIVPGIPGPGFSLSPDHDLTLLAGGPLGSSTITVTALHGFADWVDLSVDSYTPGIIPILSTLSVNIPPSGTSTLTVTAPPETRPGFYSVSITGISGSLTNTTIVSVRVSAPSFFVSPNPFTVTMQAGQTCTSTLTAGGFEGFTGPVDLTTASPNGLTPTLSQPTVSVPSSPSSTLTIEASTNIEPGFYDIKVNGTSTALGKTETTMVSVHVIAPAFRLAANPSPLIITLPTTSGTTTIYLSGENGFKGTVALATSGTLPTGVNASFSPTSINDSSSLSTMTVTVPPYTGSYEINVTGTSGSHVSWTIALVSVEGTATTGNFSLSDNATIITFAAGSSNTPTVTVSASPGWPTAVVLEASSSSTNLNASITSPYIIFSFPGTATLNLNSTIPGVYHVDILGVSGTSFFPQTLTIIVVVTGPDFSLLASPSSLTINAGASETSTISVTSSGGFSNTVNFTATSPLGITASIGTGASPVLTVAVAPTVPPGSYTIDVTGTSGGISHDVILTVNVDSFQVNLVPDSARIAQGSSGTSIVQIGAMNGFTGTVFTSTSTPPGISATPPTKSLTSGTYQLTINVGTGVSPGTYLVNVTGTSGTLSQNATLTLTVTGAKPDFTTAPATPVTVDCNAGATCSQSITVTALDSFSGTVAFTAYPSTGLTCINPGSVTGSGTSTLNCQSSTAADYTVVVYGSSGALSHATAIITYHVTPGSDFTISATSPSIVDAGQSATSTISVSAVNGFSGTVTLTDPPAGLTCGAITPGTITGSGNASVSCSATVAGTFNLTITGTSGTLVHNTTATFNFNDFSIVASSPVAVSAGQSATSTITISALNGFTGVVTLTDTVPSGLTCGSITPGSVTGSGTTTVSCSATVAGSYSLTVKGNSSLLVHTTTATFNFFDFTIAASSPSGDTGTSLTSTITITAVNGFSGVVTLTDTVPAGLTCGAITPGTVTGSGTATVSCSATVAATYNLTITGENSLLSHNATATFSIGLNFTITASSPASVNAGQPATSTITIAALNGFKGSVALTETAPTGLTCGSISPASITESGTATVSCSSTSAESFTLTITGTSTTPALTHSTTVTFNFVDFTIAASSPVVINAGQSATSTITITSVNGFAGTVTLTDTVPAGLTCGPTTPGSITGSGTATVSCSASAAGTFSLTVTGASVTLSHPTSAIFKFVDFTIAASPPSIASVGTQATSTITIISNIGFTGVVTLTDTVPSGLTCGAITLGTVTGSGTATVSCSATAAGFYVLTVTGTDGSAGPHSTTATFNFVDFTIAASGPVAVNADQSAISIITLTPSNGFTGTVSLSYSVSPTGPTATFSSPSVSGGSGISTLNINVGSGVAAGTYTVTVTATSGSLTHTVEVTVTVATVQPTAPAQILGLDPTLFYAIIGVIIAAVVGGMAVLLRSRTSGKTK